MTQRIYYTDPGCRAFDAVVRRVVTHDGRPAAVLDRTAFYPTSGGQPYDVGRLGGADVVETLDDGEGAVVHVLSSPLAEGTAVRGEIDWRRRFDHMQQHTGQHLLSASFDRLFANPTTSFHMGAATSTIDLTREVSAAEIERAVDEANRIVWEDHPVAIRFVSRDDAARLPLRKEPAAHETLRLIEIADFDLSACGGTHVSATGAVGMIAAIGAERFKGASRVTFVCGGRALAALRQSRDVVAGSIRLLSVSPEELPAAIERAQAEAKALRKMVARQQDELAVHEAARLAAAAEQYEGVACVVARLEGWDAAGLKAVAASLIDGRRLAAVLFSSDTPAMGVVACSGDAGADAAQVLKALLARFGGRGGGTRDLAQGGGLAGSSEDLRAAARELLHLSVTSPRG